MRSTEARWHGLFLLPLLDVAQLGPVRSRATLGALIIIAAELIAVFVETLLPGEFIVMLLEKDF
ncbi:MAG: hypothetical protein JST54_26295 [Deltaproteobacteria bacterium]|nr:hypothetical protein [Deltaproteobacteria bacterium]